MMFRRTFRSLTPQDRLDRCYAVKASARKAGISVSVKNRGRSVPMFLITFRQHGADAYSTFDIADAERWVARHIGGAP